MFASGSASDGEPHAFDDARDVVVRVLAKRHVESAGVFEFQPSSAAGRCPLDDALLPIARDALERVWTGAPCDDAAETPDGQWRRASELLQDYGGVRGTRAFGDVDRGTVHTLLAALGGDVPVAPRCVRVIESDDAFYFVCRRHTRSLRSVTRLGLAGDADGDATRRFIAYQLLDALSRAHARGLAHGALTPDRVLLSAHNWLYIDDFQCPLWPQRPLSSLADDVGALTARWVDRDLSNFDYLLALNRLAGRRTGDPNRHPVMPVSDEFCVFAVFC